MRVEIKKIAKDLKIALPDLITRPVGRKMYERVKKQLSVIHEDEVVLLDFEGIKVVDSSFIDEFLLRLIMDSRSSNPAFFIKLQSISDAIEINCESVFSSFRRLSEDRVAVITDRIIGNNSVYLGSLSKPERDIIDYLRVNKTVRVPEIAHYIGKSEPESEELAEVLLALRLIRRQKDGGNFCYASL